MENSHLFRERIVVYFYAMGILRTLRRLGTAVVRAAVVLYVTFCVCGSIEICLCDPDPDNCGEHCHDCDEHSKDECHHFSIDVDDFMVPHAGATVPSAPAMVCPPSAFAVAAIPDQQRTRPISTAPPDSGGGMYLSYSARIHPLA